MSQQVNPITDYDVLVDSNNIDALELQSVTEHDTANTTYNLWITVVKRRKKKHTETRRSKVHPSMLKKKIKNVILPVDANFDLKRTSAIIIQVMREQDWPFFKLVGWMGRVVESFEIGGICKKGREAPSALYINLSFKSAVRVTVLSLFPSTSEHIPANL